MANMIIDFGKKYKNQTISECDTKYLQWLVSHERVLALRNRWASRDARFELERRTQVATEAAMAVRVAEEIIAEAIEEKAMSEEQERLDMRVFKAWLKKNSQSKVGYVGCPSQMHPLLQFAQECNVSLISISKSRWAREYGKLCEEYKGIPGRIDGFAAQCLLADVVGYQKAFA